MGMGRLIGNLSLPIDVLVYFFLLGRVCARELPATDFTLLPE
jgi:hypothetical protein